MSKTKILMAVAAQSLSLAGDAALTKLGKELYKVGIMPATKTDKTGSVQDFLTAPLVQLGLVNLAVGSAESFGVTKSREAVGQCLINAAWENFISSIGPDKEKEIVSAYNKACGDAPAFNVSVGGTNVVGTAKGRDAVFGGKPGPVDTRFTNSNKPAANESKGTEVEIDMTPENDDTPPYLPKTKEELIKAPDNKFICCDPLGTGEHTRQKEKFVPWEPKHGFMEEMKGVLICGGCRDKMQAEDFKLKKAAEQAAKVNKLHDEKKSIEDGIADMEAKKQKAEATRATFAALVKDDPTNEDTVAALQTQEAKIKKLTDEIEAAYARLDEIEKIINPSADGNKTDEKKVETPAANTTQGNAKQSSSAMARLQQHKNGKK